jgi:hypothetical protein
VLGTSQYSTEVTQMAANSNQGASFDKKRTRFAVRTLIALLLTCSVSLSQAAALLPISSNPVSGSFALANEAKNSSNIEDKDIVRSSKNPGITVTDNRSIDSRSPPHLQI